MVIQSPGGQEFPGTGFCFCLYRSGLPAHNELTGEGIKGRVCPCEHRGRATRTQGGAGLVGAPPPCSIENWVLGSLHRVLSRPPPGMMGPQAWDGHV